MPPPQCWCNMHMHSHPYSIGVKSASTSVKLKRCVGLATDATTYSKGSSKTWHLGRYMPPPGVDARARILIPEVQWSGEEKALFSMV